MANPARPSNARILGKTWTIEWKPELDDGDHGATHHADLRIEMAGSHHPEHQQDTLLHELLHALDFELDLKLGERRVRLLATSLLGLLKDNPEIKNFILREPTT